MVRPKLTPGALSHILQAVAQHAAMAAQMCTTADWHYLAALCEGLSKQASMGGRMELTPLLEVIYPTICLINSAGVL
jgi:hypothetical protein